MSGHDLSARSALVERAGEEGPPGRPTPHPRDRPEQGTEHRRAIEPLLPDRTLKRGGRWRDHREVIDAITWKFQTGSQWVHLPEK
ncbi:transposase [Streptomyces mutomycini]|uniref:Transposase n=1 Tax=Streptomyces mutomycini TaxID=284036 RepID=A0ABW0B7K5_9ACTN